MITFLVTVDDVGDVLINKLSGLAQGQSMPGLLASLSDGTFEAAQMQVGDRIDLHVNIDNATRRNLVISLIDDTIPQFSSVEEAEKWMESRQSGQYSIHHG